MTTYRDMSDYEIEAELRKVCPNIENRCGVYLWWRKNPHGTWDWYGGQSVHLLRRSLEHIKQYDHLGNSIAVHGLYSADNTAGWQLKVWFCAPQDLDERERQLIAKGLARPNNRTFNITDGGQGAGKRDIGERKSAKGYNDGLRQGRKNATSEIKHIVDNYLTVALKKDGKVAERQLAKFWALLNNEDNEKENENNGNG